MNVLLDKGARIEARDKEGLTPLCFAVASEQTNVVGALVSAGADVNTQNNDGISVLNLASYKGCMEFCKYVVG